MENCMTTKLANGKIKFIAPPINDPKNKIEESFKKSFPKKK